MLDVGSLDDVQHTLSDRRKQNKTRNGRSNRPSGNRYETTSDGCSTSDGQVDVGMDDVEEVEIECKTPAGINYCLESSLWMLVKRT